MANERKGFPSAAFRRTRPPGRAVCHHGPFGSQVRRDPELRAPFAERRAAIRAMIAQLIATGTAELIATGTAELGTQPPMPADELASALLSLGIGLGLQRAIDPDIPVRVLTDVIRVFAAARTS